MGPPATDVITIIWSPDPTTGFEIWRSSDANFANATRISGRWSGSHYIDATAPAGVPRYYWVRAFTPDQEFATSPAATAYVGVAPAVTISPSNTTISAESSVTFQATASGYPAPSYQWRRNQNAISGATAASLVIPAATLDSAGDYDVVVTNAVGSATSSVSTLAVEGASGGFDGWLADFFSSDELGNLALTGPASDPDGDGVPNLVEYAVGRDPRSTTNDAAFEVSSEAGFWTFTYRRATEATDIAFQVERSTNLTNWSTADVTEEQILDSGAFTIWKARVVQSSTPNCFFRLKVTRLAN
jgi:hypothetical protein